jgi:hypothetical protein
MAGPRPIMYMKMPRVVLPVDCRTMSNNTNEASSLASNTTECTSSDSSNHHSTPLSQSTTSFQAGAHHKIQAPNDSSKEDQSSGLDSIFSRYTAYITMSKTEDEASITTEDPSSDSSNRSIPLSQSKTSNDTLTMFKIHSLSHHVEDRR